VIRVSYAERQVYLDALAHTGIGEVLAHAGAIPRIGEAAPELGELILGSRVLDVGQELSALPHQVEPTSEEIAGRAYLGRVDIRLRQQTAPQQTGNLARIDLVVLGLAAVNGLHRERVPEHK
jgi:hypothetical protein